MYALYSKIFNFTFLLGNLSNIITGYENSLLTLKCIASRCIAANKIKYKGLIPTVLESYIQVHSSDKYFT